ncbi:flagellar biosynthetic protein FliR [Burkholderia ubonensis]|uniref:Flagellar biosynthetic protein FliR n=1 Tax=Burkholderia ubonensis TaxID=101571 RepID=A0A106U733_9BURK|nr:MULTISPECIES: flagellar biosynthetic protein FliR [Burkholderia]AJX15972.1 flagellar biosynthetic protein FliR [Burkholderia ubonensis MSMB22]AOK57708.1 flagellar biosynthetic protein FliR [Burkholderia ubonensis]KIP15166.1 flagellar biosynthetic protein FliR [Burkholderia sp. MSHR3999]KVA76500.1 flagellar biosynthetic protein FliR [Burkholderia ubonensis]KVC89510.1 flagellar biosynthetic protein FliR [Burkholderia ubonensis]
MFSVTYAQLNAWLTAFLWPFVRMLALVAVAPVTGHASVPGRVKIGVAAFMALVVAPTLGAMPAVTVFSAQGIWIVVTQFLIGVAMGFTMQIVFAAAQAAGDAIGLSMGLGFATFFDPHASGATPVMGRFLNAVAILAFLAFDGHLQVLAALAASFQALPVSAELLHAPGWRTLAAFGATVFQMGLLLALPVVAALLIANLALGILNRAAPQVGIFQVGFPVTMLVGLLLVQLMVPNMVPFFGHLFDMGLDAMGRVLGGWR